MSAFQRDGEFTHAERATALLGQDDTITGLCRELTRSLTGFATDAHARAVHVALEGALTDAVFSAHLLDRAAWEQSVAEDEAFDRGKWAA